MANPQKKSGWSTEKIIIASIPAFAAIVVALISSGIFKPAPDPDITNTVSLKQKAGSINDMIVYKRYDDISPLMTEATRLMITKELMNSVVDTVGFKVGRFVKAIDTSYSQVSGTDMFFVKNQYERGINVNQIIFDKDGKIFGLFSHTDAVIR